MASWKETRRTLRRPFEAGGFIILKWVIPMMPRCLVVGVSRLAGRLAMILPIREKRIGMINLNAVFGDTKTAPEKKRILRASFATFCQTMLDVFWFSHNPDKRILQYVEFEQNELRDRFFEDRPIVCITAHMGSWEIIGQTCALMGVDLASIAATVKNKTVDRILIEQRERTGQTIIPQQGALRTLIARFRKKGKAAFVLDQNTNEADGGIMADFLGLPMSVSPAPAAMAYRTGTEIMLGFCLPEPGGRYRIRITQSIVPPAFSKELDADEVANALTQQIQDGISEQIRRYPEYWLWSYKHWRRNEGRSYPDHYPVY
jgi:KDO2-lipid IV(A) lauroyltransferase